MFLAQQKPRDQPMGGNKSVKNQELTAMRAS